MESAHFWNCAGRCSQFHSDDDCEECVVAMHIPPISVGRMSPMPAELGSMLEPGEREKENHANVNNNHQDTRRF